MIRGTIPLLASMMAASLSFATADAETTRLMVRAQSLDAKFIGTHTGGVDVTLTDVRSGKVLAGGRMTGGTGDTARIMQAPRQLGQNLADEATAGYEAVMDLNDPTLVRVDARGPLGAPSAMITVSTTLWVLPGRDVLGDGLILTFPGLIIEPRVTRQPDGSMRIAAKVTMMCGCPITPGGLWDADKVQVRAEILKGGTVVETVPLVYAGQPSQFTSKPILIDPAKVSARVIATSTSTANAGIADVPLK
jgi:hypothetical protein